MTASTFNVVYFNGAVPNVDVIYIYSGGSHTWKFLTYVLLNISLDFGIKCSQMEFGNWLVARAFFIFYQWRNSEEQNEHDFNFISCCLYKSDRLYDFASSMNCSQLSRYKCLANYSPLHKIFKKKMGNLCLRSSNCAFVDTDWLC